MLANEPSEATVLALNSRSLALRSSSTLARSFSEVSFRAFSFRLIALFLRLASPFILATKASTPPSDPLTPASRALPSVVFDLYVPDATSNSSLVSLGPANRSGSAVGSATGGDREPANPVGTTSFPLPFSCADKPAPSSDSILSSEDLRTDVDLSDEALSNVLMLLAPIDDPGRDGKTLLIGRPLEEEREGFEKSDGGRSGRS